jgi:glutathione S-transferase
MLRLITIPISHYCEKARWALDRSGIAYREEPHIQGVHCLAALRAGGGRTVPVLVTPERVVADSSEILAWVDERTEEADRLFPAEPEQRARVQELCTRLNLGLGPTGRRLIYAHMLRQRELMLRYNNQGVPAWEDLLMRRARPAITGFVVLALGIRSGREALDEAAVWRELDFVASLLADGRPYLLGERFGAADLTFAALAAPVILPPVYGVPLPQPELLAPDTAALVQRAREHPAGRYALDLIAEHRLRRVADRAGA